MKIDWKRKLTSRKFWVALIGFITALLVAFNVDSGSVEQITSIIMSFAVCTFTGVFFGWYPAKKAAKLDPIEAIRYE